MTQSHKSNWAAFRNQLTAEDFPVSESWRLLTDEWQQPFGLEHYRPTYYAGMQEGMALGATLPAAAWGCDELEALQAAAFQPEKYGDSYIGMRDKHELFAHIKQPFLHDAKDGCYYQSGISEHGLPQLIKRIRAVNGKFGSATHIRFVVEEDDNPLQIYLLHANKNYCLNGSREQQLSNDQAEKNITESLKLLEDPENGIGIILEVGYHRTRENCAQAFKDFSASVKGVLDEKEISSERRKQVITAIAQLCETLNMNHPFRDGNGRACILLLCPLLIHKYLKTRVIIQTPQHYLGYLPEELAAEIETGIAKFEDYKVTKAVKYVEFLKKDILTDKDVFSESKAYQKTKEELSLLLSSKPLVALAQLNELYRRYVKKPVEKKFLGFFRSKPSTLASLLAELYSERVTAQIERQGDSFVPAYADHDWVASKGAFFMMINRHADILQYPELREEVRNKIHGNFQDVIFSPNGQMDLAMCKTFYEEEEESLENNRKNFGNSPSRSP